MRRQSRLRVHETTTRSHTRTPPPRRRIATSAAGKRGKRSAVGRARHTPPRAVDQWTSSARRRHSIVIVAIAAATVATAATTVTTPTRRSIRSEYRVVPRKPSQHNIYIFYLLHRNRYLGSAYHGAALCPRPGHRQGCGAGVQGWSRATFSRRRRVRERICFPGRYPPPPTSHNNGRRDFFFVILFYPSCGSRDKAVFSTETPVFRALFRALTCVRARVPKIE